MTNSTQTGWRRLWHSTSFRLAFLAFAVYQMNLRSVSSADTFPMRYAPISLLTEGDLDLDEFTFLQDQPYPGPPGSNLPYYLQYHDGHYLSTPPVWISVLVTPVYAIPVWLGLTGDPGGAPPEGGGLSRVEVMGTLLSKIGASLLIAISVAFVHLGLREIATPSGALWITLAYAFATSSWAVSSQGLWQTTGSQAALAAAFYAILHAERRQTRAGIVAAGACVAIAVMCRPTAAVFAILLTLYVFHRHRRHLIAYLPIPGALATVLLGYNLYYFGTLKGGYEGYYAVHEFTWSQISEGLSGLLISPNRGILVFSPVLIPALAGMFLSFRRKPELLKFLAIGVASTVAFYSTFTQWHGQFSFSYRYLVDQLPALALLAAPTWSWLTDRSWRLRAVAVLAAFSVCIQIVGAFFYPCDWYRSTRTDPAAIARFFDWSDLEVVQCLRAGPVDPDGLKLLRGLLR